MDLNAPDNYLEHVQPAYPDWRREARSHPERANLCNAVLIGSNLNSANLGGANVRGANLSGADLIRANLDGADSRRREPERRKSEQRRHNSHQPKWRGPAQTQT